MPTAALHHAHARPPRPCGARSRRLGASALIAALWLFFSGSPRAHAQLPPVDTATPIVPEETPRPRHVGRALLEGAALQLGFTIWYWRDLDFNSRDWDLAWNGRSWREKARLSALRFDQNLMSTNALAHGFAGVGNYHIARGNGFDLPGSVAAAFVTSVFWEYMVEFREYPSLNDIITNTVAGVAIGEPLYQLGELLLRSSPTFFKRAAAGILSPVAATNDWVDGRKRPTEPTDGLGFTRAAAHRFRTRLAYGSRTFDRALTRTETLVGGDGEIMMLPGYGRLGLLGRWTRPGDWTSMRVRAGLDSGGLTEFTFRTRTSLLGYYKQQLSARPDGHLYGQSMFLGLASAFEYEDVGRPGGGDHVAILNIAGPLVDLSVRNNGLRARWVGEAYPTFGMVDALAFKGRLPPLDKEGIYRPADHGGRIPGVVGARGYAFSAGFGLGSRLELDYWAWEAGAEVQIDRFRSIRGRDRFREQLHDEFLIRDDRSLGRVWLGLHPWGPALGITGSLGWRWRRGWADSIQASTFDRRMDLGLTLVF